LQIWGVVPRIKIHQTPKWIEASKLCDYQVFWVILQNVGEVEWKKEVAPTTMFFLPRTDKTFNVLINVTLTCVHETIVAVECSKDYILWVCVCILALVIQCAVVCNVHTHYLWPFWLCSIFPHYLINAMIFKHKMHVLIFCTTSVWDISHYKTGWVRYDHKCIMVSV